MNARDTRYTLDTNALVYYLNDESSVVAHITQWRTSHTALYVSTITELEILSQSSLTSQDTEIINALLATLVIMPVDTRIARIAAGLRRKYRMRTPDSAIAATALLTESVLVTRDVAHFRPATELKLQTI